MNALTPEQREIVARLQSGRLMICEGQGDPNSDGCGGQGYTGAAGQEPCPHCYGAGVMTPELQAALASAPSPEAGAGGDLGGPSREAVEMMAEHLHEEHEYDHTWVWPAHADDDGYRGDAGYVRLTPPDIQARMREMARRVLIRADQIAHRSGKLVPSTGSGEETKGEPPAGSGSREPGPTVPAYGFDPSRVEAAAQAYYDGMIGDERTQWPHHDGWAGKSEAFKSKVRAHMARALDAALGTEARSAETFGLGPKDDGPACKATPKSSPSQTPVDPQMTVEEARALMDGLDPSRPPEHYVEELRRIAKAGDTALTAPLLVHAGRLEAALRTLQAAGEVR